eukprot:GFUD01016347.1.p1 GENE.GFUD01016347.1~~GFUD01016347.1.p1  ORF type:complete len:475 (+),score=71.76 GFUD01016347.1:168-1592(+)
MLLRKMGQNLCSPKPDLKKTFQFPEELHNEPSLDKDSMKPKEDDVLEKSLVPSSPLCSSSRSATTARSTNCNASSSLTKTSAVATSYTGLINLFLMMCAVMLMKLFLGLCAGVGVAIDWPTLASVIPTNFSQPLPLLIFPPVVMLLTFRVELLLSQNKVSWDNALPCHLASFAMVLALPVLGLRRQDHLDGLLSNLLICVSYITLAMKLVSYVQVNKKYRDEQIASNNNGEQVYPDNITLWSIAYFWVSPTLTYQPNFSYTLSIDLKVVLYRVLELCMMHVMMRSVLLATPSVIAGLLKAVEDEELLVVIERFLTLSLFTITVWMLGFYLLFVSFLQLTAELLQFNERKFFHAWWNASTMEEFWRWWNLPVHRWAVKHIYVPFVKSGWSKINAMLAVFLTSALLHEYFISCPFQIVGHFAFVTFLGQLPLCMISEVTTSKCGGRMGNFFVWGFLVFWNSVGVVVYYTDVVRATR